MITDILAQSDPVFLVSWFKPLVFVVVLVGWAWVASQLDKDAAYYYLPRIWTNLGQMACGVVGFGLMLLIPIFPVGFVLALAVLCGGISGYAYYRNTKVPESECWTLSLDSFRHRLDQAESRRAQRQATLNLLSNDQELLEVPSGNDPRVVAHSRFQDAIDFAIPRGASQIDMVVDSKRAGVVVWVDGVKYPQSAIEPGEAVAMLDYLKTAAGLDLEDRRKKQVGVMYFESDVYGRRAIAVTTAGSTRGITLSLGLDGAQRVEMSVEHIGLLETQKKQLKQLRQQKGKVVIVAVPSKQGATTTVYSLLQEHDPYIESIVTFEEQVVFEIEGVDHNNLPAGTQVQPFNDRLNAMLRADPDVVMISRLPDGTTAQLIANHCQETRFYINLPADNTKQALRNWVKLVGDHKLAARSLGGIISQRLVRKLCETCRTAYRPDPAALKKMNLPADKVGDLYHSSGQVVVKDKPQPCPNCHGIGYRGRLGVFELMILDDAARQLIRVGDLDRLRSHLRKQKMLLLQEAGMAKIVEGVTDVKEITRALSEKARSKKKRRTKPSDDKAA